jgi:hypothetical protein
MTMAPGLRKLSLTTHVATSVAWLGAVLAFLVLAIAGLTRRDELSVRAVYIAMDLVTRFVIVPLCLASLLSGIVQSLGTPWGLFRHYWVVIKLLLTVVSTALLLLHAQVVALLGRTAFAASFALGGLREARAQLVVDAAAAVLVLLVATTLATFKPRGALR